MFIMQKSDEKKDLFVVDTGAASNLVIRVTSKLNIKDDNTCLAFE